MSWRYEPKSGVEEIRKCIKDCEGKHVQQAIFSTFMDTLTQVCFTEMVVRSSIQWEGNLSWPLGSK